MNVYIRTQRSIYAHRDTMWQYNCTMQSVAQRTVHVLSVYLQRDTRHQQCPVHAWGECTQALAQTRYS